MYKTVKYVQQCTDSFQTSYDLIMLQLTKPRYWKHLDKTWQFLCVHVTELTGIHNGWYSQLGTNFKPGLCYSTVLWNTKS